ncbi:hypothetical protein NAV33_07295 [Pseudomonas stutzeri]|uniref:hypothetical protein n=1 Tax=Stutzerimonas stutzeri TaxID=316 RepID=UPI00210DF812|nr:hypothetical protein [Stutzerimonas stutzeri]MCQ4311699.1 hypothetical protein [Stutzerimonas stutzeri]
MYTPDYTNAGIAGFQNDSVAGAVELFAGDTPAPVTVSAKVPADLATAGIPAWTPVSVDFETDTIALVDGTTVTKANAITVAPVAAGSPATTSVPVYKAGMFNINAPKWPATFATEAAKLAAFDLAACQIYVKKPYYA